MARAFSRARSSTIRQAGPGHPPAASPPDGRYHTATLLPNGKVLVAGGFDGTFSMSSAELYDPVSGTWTPTGDLATERESHTATLLPSGQVHIAGGITAGTDYIVGILASAELYDPVSGTWTATGSLATATDCVTRRSCYPTARSSSQVVSTTPVAISRARNFTIRRAARGPPLAASPPHTMLTRLRCCLTARCSSQAVKASGYLTSAELYDPASGTWTATASLTTGRDWSHGNACYPTARCSSPAVNVSGPISRARNSTIRRAGLGQQPATSARHAGITRRRCFPTARCSSQAVSTTTPVVILRVRNFTIRQLWRSM